MDQDGIICIGAAVGGTPVHFQVYIDTSLVGVLTIPGDEQSGNIISDVDEPLVVRYILDGVCHEGNLDIFNNRLTLTEV